MAMMIKSEVMVECPSVPHCELYHYKFRIFVFSAKQRMFNFSVMLVVRTHEFVGRFLGHALVAPLLSVPDDYCYKPTTVHANSDRIWLTTAYKSSLRVKQRLKYAPVVKYMVVGSMVKTATGQNGDTETATEMAIFKRATTPNNTYAVLLKPI